MPATIALILAFVGLVLPLSPATAAQSALPSVGELYFGNPTSAAYYRNAFREGLRELSYVEGRNIRLITRYAEGDPTKLHKMVEEFVSLRVDAMFLNEKAVPFAKKMTSTIPIVSAGFTDPVGEGLAQSLGRPGGNVTGLSWQSLDASEKRLQLALELVPTLKRVAVLTDPDDPGIALDAKAIQRAASTVGVKVIEIPVRGASDFAAALAKLKAQRPQVLITSDAPSLTTQRDALCRFAIENQLPFISEGRHWADAGALVTYGPSGAAMYKRAAYYVDRLLKGAKAAELPIEQPMTFELVVNLKTAKALGLVIPEQILVRASDVIR